jgi:hypothetical protein
MQAGFLLFIFLFFFFHSGATTVSEEAIMRGYGTVSRTGADGKARESGVWVFFFFFFSFLLVYFMIYCCLFPFPSLAFFISLALPCYAFFLFFLSFWGAVF